MTTLDESPKHRIPGTHSAVLFAVAGFLVGGAASYLLMSGGVPPPPVGVETNRSASAPQDSTALCRLLLPYLREGKINGEILRAARCIIAKQGRTSGYWRELLAALKGQPSRDFEANGVIVLGRMLAADAAARRALETGEGYPWAVIPQVALGPEVVADLLLLAEQTERSLLDHHVVALVRADDPRTQGFFRGVLKKAFGEPNLISIKFHAAVGLANLGDPAGVDWLIEHCEEERYDVINAWPAGASKRSLGACCQQALRAVSGNEVLNTRPDWRQWWHDARRTLEAGSKVTLHDAYGIGSVCGE